MDVLAKTIRHHTPEVQQRSKYTVFMTSLFFVDGVLAIGDHVDGFAQFDNPIGPNLVPLVCGFLDSEPLLLIPQRPSVVAVSPPEQ
ncbi:MAG: hypothetical protein FGM52_03360 [Mycobacterium sp.]|nr:hypothetical protein [Mycobacterium sp.]